MRQDSRGDAAVLRGMRERRHASSSQAEQGRDPIQASGGVLGLAAVAHSCRASGDGAATPRQPPR